MRGLLANGMIGDMKLTKAQMSFLSKPVMLVMTIAVLLILLQTVWSNPKTEKEQELTVQLMTRASEILDILLSSEDCLAMRSVETESAYAYVVSKQKLDEFSKLYNNKEPPCAKNFEYGYTVTVEEHCVDDVECLSWTFGSTYSSPSADLIGKQSRTLPVGILHGSKDIRVGKATIILFDGSLERVAGFLDKTCLLGPTGEIERSMKVYINYPLTISGSEICLGNACRGIDCPAKNTRIEAGSLDIIAKYSQGILEVSG